MWIWGDLNISSMDQNSYSDRFQNLKNFLSGFSPTVEAKDILVWRNEVSAVYNVREGYQMMMDLNMQESESPDQCRVFCILWRIQVPTRIKSFRWRFFLNRLEKKDQLIKIGVWIPIIEGSCALCDQTEENLTHLLFECPVSSKIWYFVGSWWLFGFVCRMFVEIFFGLVWFDQQSIGKHQVNHYLVVGCLMFVEG